MPTNREENFLRLMESFRIEECLNQKTDIEIANLLLEHVWAEMDMTSPESVVVVEAIERLKRAQGGPLKYSAEQNVPK